MRQLQWYKTDFEERSSREWGVDREILCMHVLLLCDTASFTVFMVRFGYT